MIEHNRAYVISGNEGPEAETREADLWRKQDAREAEYVAAFDLTELVADALAWRMLESIVGIPEAVAHREAMNRVLFLLPDQNVAILSRLAAMRAARLLEVEKA